MTRKIYGLMLTVLFLAFAGVGMAQTSQDSTRDLSADWEKVADRAERVIDTARASSASLERLRAEIVSYRESFSSAREENTDRIKTLQSQVDALGPEPETGEEPEDIAKLRIDLNEQLNALTVPRVVAEEAYTRADGLIGEVDRIIRDRQASQLLARGPSPLNPAYWPEAGRDIRDALRAMKNEVVQGWQSEATREHIRQNLPVILSLIAIGLLLILFGGRLSERLGDYLRSFGGRGSGVWGFAVSLFKIILPMAGIFALVRAISMTGLLGVRGDLALESVPLWAAILLVFNWLGDQLYSRRREDDVIPIPEARRAQILLYVRSLSLMLVLYNMVGLYEQVEDISAASRAVTGFPIILCSALLLSRLQYVGMRAQEDIAKMVGIPGRGPAVARIFNVMRRGALVMAVVAPILAAFGYGSAAEGIIYPMILTLALMAGTMVLQRFFGNLIELLSRTADSGSKDSLFSVLVGFLLILAALPLLALIWGARVADLTELWSRFLEGFQIGNSRLSPVGFLVFVMVFIAGYMVTRLLQAGLRSTLLPKTTIDAGGQNAIVAFTGYLGIFLSALMAVSSAGLDLSSLAIVAGALSVGIGFGLQNIVSNFVSGIILLIERPIAKGDWIEVAGQQGIVRDISVRSTRIETFDRFDVIVPNSDLVSGTVTNYTRGNTIGRVIVPVGVAYGTDTEMVERVLLEIANQHPMVLAKPPPSVAFKGFGADAMDFEIRAILRDINWSLSVRSSMNHDIAKRFAQEGIEIPFAQRDIWLRNPEVLQGKTDGTDDKEALA